MPSFIYSLSQFSCALLLLYRFTHTHTHTCSLSFRWYYSLYLACPVCPPLLHVLPLSLATSLPSCFFTSLSGYLFPSVTTLFSLPLPSHMLSQACLSLPLIFYLTVCDLASSLPESLPPFRFPSIDIPFCSSPFVPSLVCNIFHSFSHPVSASRLPRMFIHAYPTLSHALSIAVMPVLLLFLSLFCSSTFLLFFILSHAALYSFTPFLSRMPFHTHSLILPFHCVFTTLCPPRLSLVWPLSSLCWMASLPCSLYPCWLPSPALSILNVVIFPPFSATLPCLCSLTCNLSF